MTLVHKMTRARLLLVITAIILAAGVAHQAAAVQTSGATMVCDVVVVTADGQPLAGVTAGDVEVLSDGVHLPVISLVAAPPAVNIIVMIDLSTSQPLKRYEVQAGLVEHWLPTILRADTARVGVVGAPPVFSDWFANDRAIAPRIREVIDRALSEPSPIWDSADAAVQALSGVPGTKVVVLMTDGRAAGNRIGVDDVARRAIAADVSISVVSEGSEVFLPQKDGTVMRVRTDASLKWLAEATGGIYVEDGAARRISSPRLDAFAYAWDLVHKPSQPGPSLVAVMTALRSRYRLTYEAAADGRTHALDVRIKTPGAIVRAKRSYVALTRR
jgi:hypothetical protein